MCACACASRLPSLCRVKQWRGRRLRWGGRFAFRDLLLRRLVFLREADCPERWKAAPAPCKQESGSESFGTLRAQELAGSEEAMCFERLLQSRLQERCKAEPPSEEAPRFNSRVALFAQALLQGQGVEEDRFLARSCCATSCRIVSRRVLYCLAISRRLELCQVASRRFKGR